MLEKQIESKVSQAVAAELAKYRRRRLLVWGICLVFMPITIWAASISIPNRFSDGDTLSATKLNDNFDTLKNKVNDLDSISGFDSTKGFWRNSVVNSATIKVYTKYYSGSSSGASTVNVAHGIDYTKLISATITIYDPINTVFRIVEYGEASSTTSGFSAVVGATNITLGPSGTNYAGTWNYKIRIDYTE